MPVSSVFLLCTILVFILTRGSLVSKLESFSRGASSANILLMIWIFILAGAFAGTARDMGSIRCTVDTVLSVVSPHMLFIGLFLASCVVSMAVGTSVGTIVALTPIASGIASQIGADLAFVTAIVVGGAFFGDNLSFISDTTIAATRIAGCEMKDKFKTNIKIILPAVIAVGVLYYIKGLSFEGLPDTTPSQIYKIIPYILIIVLALSGLNVVLVLAIGIAAVALIGFVCGDFTFLSWMSSIGNGIAGMNDLIVVTLLAGGLLGLIRDAGGLDYVMKLITRIARGPRGAQFGIAALVCVANVLTANNTIAIITVGPVAADIARKFGIGKRKLASLLDTFSCFTQGLLPYGAQLLMASSLAGLGSVDIIPHLYYPFVMGACAFVAILFNYPKN